jgi:ribokinase
MRILNFGSLNYDCVYSVDHIVLPGETIAAGKMETFCGGKGLNQSVALARAGAEVFHAGLVGEDGGALLETLQTSGVNCTFVRSTPGKSGHAIIQLDAKGQNSIVLYGGSNRRLTAAFVDEVFSAFGQSDMLLLQNEVNDIDLLIEKADQKGMKIAFNPSPFDGAVKKCDLKKISFLFINEIEGYEISGEKRPDGILDFFAARCPKTAIILTLGQDGVRYGDKRERIDCGIYPVKVADTTAAGDTFTGFFLTAVAGGEPVRQALDIASRASAIAVSRPGAAPSIPTMQEVRNYKFR